MTNDYKRDSKGRFVKGTKQPYGFGKGKQTIPHNFNGGSIDATTGYKRVYIEGERRYEHQVVWEEYNGTIPKGCIVHHIDEDKLNNNISNLQCMSIGKHNKLHKLGEGI